MLMHTQQSHELILILSSTDLQMQRRDVASQTS